MFEINGKSFTLTNDIHRDECLIKFSEIFDFYISVNECSEECLQVLQT